MHLCESVKDQSSVFSNSFFLFLKAIDLFLNCMICTYVYYFFGHSVDTSEGPNSHRHHEESSSAQLAFANDVQSLIQVIDDLGNPFEEKSSDLLVLHTKEIADPSVIKTVRLAKTIGKRQFESFTNDRIVERTRAIEEPLKRNKLPLFGTIRKSSTQKGKETSLKNDMTLFARLYIGCQNRDGNLDVFFRHENQMFPPSLSDSGKMHQCNKSDLLICLENLTESQPPTTPNVTSIILDGAVIVRMLKPGTAKTFEEYGNEVFLPYICRQTEAATRVDLVWDTYKVDSLKSATRERRVS